MAGPKICCTPGGIRTPNPQSRSLMLYPVELRMQIFLSPAKKQRDPQNGYNSHKTFVGPFGTTDAFDVMTNYKNSVKIKNADGMFHEIRTIL